MLQRLCNPRVLATTLLLAACARPDSIGPNGGVLEKGTWGGEGAGVIVDDTIAHVHINCTFGNFAAPVTLDANGRFSVSGEYVLRAYPIQLGPPLPAQFAGIVSGKKLILTVAVNDTVEKKVVALGPATVYFDRTPQLGPCPICRKPVGFK